MDDEAKLTLHGLRQHYVKLKDNEKNRKLFELLDVLEFNQVASLLYTFYHFYPHSPNVHQSPKIKVKVHLQAIVSFKTKLHTVYRSSFSSKPFLDASPCRSYWWNRISQLSASIEQCRRRRGKSFNTVFVTQVKSTVWQ